MDTHALDFHVFPEGHEHQGQIACQRQGPCEPPNVHIRMELADAELFIRIQHKLTSPYLITLAESVRMALDNYLEELAAEIDKDEAARFLT